MPRSYVWVSAGTNFSLVSSSCQKLGGDLVSYNTGGEQQQVENFFRGTAKIAVSYWIGLSFSTTVNRWMWSDGTDGGNGAVSNASPYAHWCVAGASVHARSDCMPCVVALHRRLSQSGPPTLQDV